MPQSLARVILHVVFSTQNREPLILSSFQEDLHSYLCGILRGLGCMPMRTGGTADHVHLLFALSRTTTIANVVQKLKAGSSSWAKTKSPALADFQWQNGYGAFSVSEADVKGVMRYISGQAQHHRIRAFQEEYVELLRTYGLVYDERYVWS